MSKLISGKEALIAWYDGVEVEVNYAEKGWKLLKFPDYGIDVFKSENHTFRIKPKTITLNGIEVPAPFEPKEGDEFWYISPMTKYGYDVGCYGDKLIKNIQFGAWRTEDEIKQVVAALRSVFKGGKMTEQQIKKQAPDGATHYTDDDGDVWYIKHDGINVYLWFGIGGWIQAMPNKMLGCEKPL